MKKCEICDVQISGQKIKYCSNKCKQKAHYDSVKNQPNTYHSQTLRALRRKIELVDLKGGECSNCGYSKNLAALHFHHLDPNLKEIELDVRRLGNNKMESLLKEVEKCILLCANCHAEEHNPDYEKEKIIIFLAENKRN
jgi:hypothetical protein